MIPCTAKPVIIRLFWPAWKGNDYVDGQRQAKTTSSKMSLSLTDQGERRTSNGGRQGRRGQLPRRKTACWLVSLSNGERVRYADLVELRHALWAGASSRSAISTATAKDDIANFHPGKRHLVDQHFQTASGFPIPRSGPTSPSTKAGRNKTRRRLQWRRQKTDMASFPADRRHPGKVSLSNGKKRSTRKSLGMTSPPTAVGPPSA